MPIPGMIFRTWASPFQRHLFRSARHIRSRTFQDLHLLRWFSESIVLAEYQNRRSQQIESLSYLYLLSHCSTTVEMASVCLSKHDINILEKIKDPESNPYAGIVLDSSLPRDPNITDATIYERVVERERDIIRSIQSLETQLKSLGSEEGKDIAVKGYQQSLSAVESMIAEHPNYASARNNRVQILRRLYGDAMMLSDTKDNSAPLIESPDQAERKKAVVTALSDIEASIALLTPSSPTMPISPQVARTLSMAHTQRAALYLKTARLMLSRSLDIDGTLEESKWEKLDFEGAASRDLAFGGRYGNPIAKGLAVSVNPTAKLCGQIVREAMKKEYGPSFGD